MFFLEENLLIEYAKHHNATVYFDRSQRKNLGDIYKNWTGTGVLKMFAEDRADVASCASGKNQFHAI